VRRYELQARTSGGYFDIERDKKKVFEKTKKDAHLNALQIKYAYAVTCHKSQGGRGI